MWRVKYDLNLSAVLHQVLRLSIKSEHPDIDWFHWPAFQLWLIAPFSSQQYITASLKCTCTAAAECKAIISQGLYVSCALTLGMFCCCCCCCSLNPKAMRSKHISFVLAMPCGISVLYGVYLFICYTRPCIIPASPFLNCLFESPFTLFCFLEWK